MGFKKFKNKFFGKVGVPSEEKEETDYVELNSNVSDSSFETKIAVQFFELHEFKDVKKIIKSIREGYNIAIVNIRKLKEKDVGELKRAVEKIKKSARVSDGSIKGFGNDWLLVTPSFVEIAKTEKMKKDEQ
ncbi:MAG: cell division protein SepF [Candidatus Woesearchaeota archaeon]